jgi:predicted RNase H-like HicB family nuclease
LKFYHVSVIQDDGWLIGRMLEREGVTTQGRTLDELVFMVRDAISLMWAETEVQLELIIPGRMSTANSVRSRTR